LSMSVNSEDRCWDPILPAWAVRWLAQP
jgi:hypothetical protein